MGQESAASGKSAAASSPSVESSAQPSSCSSSSSSPPPPPPLSSSPSSHFVAIEGQAASSLKETNNNVSLLAKANDLINEMKIKEQVNSKAGEQKSPLASARINEPHGGSANDIANESARHFKGESHTIVECDSLQRQKQRQQQQKQPQPQPQQQPQSQKGQSEHEESPSSRQIDLREPLRASEPSEVKLPSNHTAHRPNQLPPPISLSADNENSSDEKPTKSEIHPFNSQQQQQQQPPPTKEQKSTAANKRKSLTQQDNYSHQANYDNHLPQLPTRDQIHCRRHRLSYLQGLLLTKWPCLPIGLFIMSSLISGLLLSIATVYLMQSVTDCSVTLLRNPPITRPEAMETPVELAPLQLTGSGIESVGRSFLSGSQDPLFGGASGEPMPKFQRLSGAVWPTHYDLFIQPRIAEPFNFTGKVEIRLVCKQASSNITLHSRDLSIDESSINLAQLNETTLGHTTKAAVPKVKSLGYDKELQHSIFHLDGQLQANREYLLSIKFGGHLSDDLAGFYKIKYDRPNSTEPTWIAATQFQATDARRAFPCFDEPLYKATFSIQIKHWKNMTALSNMPIIEQQSSPDGLWITDTFAKSHHMSTYLVAFAVTNFESRSDGNISVWARPGLVHTAEYALKITSKILRHYEEFFGIEYPLPKMDMIALPDFHAGAMENWGLITYRETAMLYDERVSSLPNKQRIALVVAHELAHQWFGNLVTPKWWDDLWLNEGFASFVEYIGVDHVEPDWKMMDQFVTEELQGVFRLDALSSSHQISIPVNAPDEISEIFDHISYSKGASIIRMMRSFLTEPVLKAGLRKYLRALKYANAEQSDLWAHLTQAQPAENKVDVGKVMDSWTLQVGFPLVTLTRQYNEATRRAQLEQARYQPQQKRSQPASADLVKWEVPITLTWKSEQNWDTKTRLWLHQNDTGPIQLEQSMLPPSDDEWMLVNVGQVGYYRVNYDSRNWNLLIEQLKSDHKKISTTNRAQILDDLFELARSNVVNYSLPMEATKYLSKEEDFVPWDTALLSLGYLDEMLHRTAIYGDWKDYLTELMAPLQARYKDLEWTIRSDKDKRNEPSLLEVYNQVNAIAWACQNGDEVCIGKAKSLFDKWKGTGENNIDPALRYSTYCTAIENGNKSDWNFLWAAYEREQAANERDRIMRALSCSKEAWILVRYLDWSFDPSKSIRRQDGATVFKTIAKNNYGRDIAFNFLRENWPRLKETYGRSSFSFGNLIRSVAASMNTQTELNQLVSFYESVKNDLGTGRRAFQLTIEEVETNVAWRNRNYPFFEKWIKEMRSVKG